MKNRPRNGKDVNCEACGKLFYITPTRIKNNKSHTCSKLCLGKIASRKFSTKEEHECYICKTKVLYKPSHAKNVKYKTCSMACAGEAKKIYNVGNNNPKSLKLNILEKYLYERTVSIKRRSDAAQIPFDLDYKYLIELYDKQQGLCHYSGIKMETHGKASKTGNASPRALSVDKIVPELGYIKGNIVLCLNAINIFKGNQEMFGFREIIEGLILNIKESFPMKVKKLYDDSKLPEKLDPLAAGIDIYTHRIEDCGEYIKVYSGIAIEPKFGYYFMLTPRSSAHKKGLTLFNNLGIIDVNYRGEIIGLFLKTDNYQMPEVGSRLMQLIPQRQIWVKIEEVDELEETERGVKGFGSSGV